MRYEDVARAAIALQDGGVRPTIESVRKKMGGGSNRDIAPLFRQWKSEREEARDAEGIGIPDNIVSAIQEFAERAKTNATNKLQRENAALADQVRELTDALRLKEEEVNRRSSQLVAARDQVVAAEAKVETYETRIRKLEDELAATHARHLEIAQKYAEQWEKLRGAEDAWREIAALKRENRSLLERATKAEAQLAFAERQIAQERDLRLPLLRGTRDADDEE